MIGHIRLGSTHSQRKLYESKQNVRYVRKDWKGKISVRKKGKRVEENSVEKKGKGNKGMILKLRSEALMRVIDRGEKVAE